VIVSSISFSPLFLKLSSRADFKVSSTDAANKVEAKIVTVSKYRINLFINMTSINFFEIY
jgi:hypothetical protein